MASTRLEPPTLETLRAASVQVVVGSVAFAGLGGLAGSTIGVVRNVPAIPLAFATSLNTGVFAFTFFSFREYLVHPLFTSLHFHPLDESPHTRNLVSTSLAGLSAGTLVSYFARGSRGAGRSGATLALGCTVVQSIVNEADLLRIKTLAWSEERQRILADIDAGIATESVETPPSYTRSISSPVPSVPSRETFSERSDRLIGGGVGWFKDALARVSPVKKMDDAEYKEKLSQRLEVIEREKAELAMELEKLEVMRRP
ncbi:hypothetical protein RQP46_000430 [Phenoliferia psychrophenolica]